MYLIFKDLQTRIVQNHFASLIFSIICSTFARFLYPDLSGFEDFED